MTDYNPDGSVARPAVDPSLVSYTHVIYALHSLSVLIGLFTVWAVVSAFIFGLPSIIAVIMNYARRSDAQGTYLETHFSWQIRTFWGAVASSLVIWVVSIPLMIILIGIAVFYIGFALLGLWVIYRVIRGWTALNAQRPVP